MSGKKKILLIEDEHDLCEALRINLEKAGWQVLVAYDGVQGLEQARKYMPDLILLDIIMPNMNGYQVCHDIKKDTKTKKIPVIMLTARTQATDRSWGKEIGANDYITKPFVMADLIHRIQTHLQAV